MNLKQVPHSLFDDYLFGEPGRNKSPSRSPVKKLVSKENSEVSFAQLSKQTSRHGSIKKGLFRMEIEKSKLKTGQEKPKITNPYYLLTGSAQPSVNKSPSKLLNLKSYKSENRPKSRHRMDTRVNFNGQMGALPQTSSQNREGLKSESQEQRFRISFTSLTKNLNKCSTTSATSNESSKENRSLLNNLKESSKVPLVKLMDDNKNSIQISRQSSAPCLILKQSLNKPLIPQHPTKLSTTSFDENDEVNVSVSDSLALLNLDMNPYLM